MSDHEGEFSYMRWAKLRSTARFNLATSGVENFPLQELPARIEDLEITGPGLYGYAPLRERLSRKTGAADECLALSLGTSMANFIALCALLNPGDEVLIEQPGYQPLLRIARWLGAKVRSLQRDPTRNWQIDLNHVHDAIGPKTRVIILTNLHNPSSTLLQDAFLRDIGAMADRAGATVLVDEVYLESVFDRSLRSAFFLRDNFVITSSLTKAYGLSGLRCGWILAQPDLIRHIHDLIDMTYGVLAHSAERLSVIALDHLDQITARSRALIETNRALLNSFLSSHSQHLECRASHYGTTVAPRLRHGDSDTFCTVLRDRYETTVVPGHFFGTRQHFRIGIGGPTATLQAGLERISAALHQLT
jgi:aspartate/methionine/tyrosine aminotransferase